MGGSSSSKQTTNVTNVREDNIFSNSGVSGDVLNVGKAGGNVTVNKTTTDYGAVGAALDFAAENSRTLSDTAQAALEGNQRVAENAFDEAFGFGRAALDSNTDTVKTALNANRDVIMDAFSSMEWRDQQQRQTVERMLESVDSANTSDSAETMQSAFKYSALAVAVVGGSYFLSNWLGRG